MKPHLCIFLWIVLSHCVTGDMKLKKEVIGNNVGEVCDKKCNGINLICNNTLHKCQCRPDFPIVVTTNRHVLCLQPAKLGEECLDKTACLAEDENSDCTQVANNAVCRCKTDYHDVHDKSTRKHRCVPETQLLNSDLATLIGVGAGMTLFCGLTCLVLRIFARARFGPRHHHYANAHLAPPITLSTDHETKRRFFRKTGLSRAQRSFDSTSPVPSPSSSMDSPVVMLRPASSTGNSGSLDESEIKMNRHRRFMTAPRRARSAERFDGMRVAYSGSGELSGLTHIGDDVLARNYRSPQPLRNGVDINTMLTRPRQSPIQTIPMPSPPPPYASAITDIRDPPSYRQAVAMTKPGALNIQGHHKHPHSNPRFNMPNRATQSLDTNLGITTNNLRTVSSNPLFVSDTANEVICNCSKCQALQRSNDMGYGEYNDAVYMESQAFLMHEIMTDGMAFCSIM